jgi:hypothetical protein
MAALRPLVLLYQEFASVSIPASVPDLNTIIVGPAYHCQDYPADSANTSGGLYGDREAANIPTGGGAIGLPVFGSDAIIIADPPNNAVGATLVSSSVDVWMEDMHLQITDDEGVAACDFTAVAPDENLFSDGTGSKDFQALGVRPGDRFVTTGSLGPAETVEFVIQEVGGWAGSTLSVWQLRMTANYTAVGTDIDGAAYAAGDPTERTYRIERVLDTAQVGTSFVEVLGNQISIKGGMTHLYDVTGDGTDETLLVTAGDTFIVYCSLRQDLAVVNEIEDTDDIEAAVGPIDERNPLAVGLFVALQNTETPIYYIGTQKDSINGAVDRLAGYTDVLDELEARKDIFAIVPLSAAPAVLAAYRAHVVGLATPEKGNFRHVIGAADLLPTTKVTSAASITGTTEEVAADIVDLVFSTHADTFLATGVRANDNFYIPLDASGSREGAYVVDEVLAVGDGIRLTTAIAANAGAGAEVYYILRGTGQVNRTLTAATVFTPASMIVTNTEFLATDVGKVIRFSGGSGPPDASPIGAGNYDFLITAVSVGVSATLLAAANWTLTPTGTLATILDPVVSTVDNSAPATPVHAPATVFSRKAYRQLLDTGAAFSTDGVLPGDLLEITMPPSVGGTDFTTVTPYSAAVFSVLSENRLLLVADSDIPVVDYTTPQATVGYRVTRSLSKLDQVTDLVLIPPSYAEKRLSIVFPDLVTVAGVQNEKTGVQSQQSSVYLACAVGGMSAGLPPHQGFTNIGIAGISEIHNSSRYFSEDQLEDLSNSGYYLFVQDTKVTLPYALHQLTTDVTSLESGEFSFVKNFDYVSRFYKDILDDFLGKYNVIDEVLDVLREALNGGTEQLLTQKYPRIGTPVKSAIIDRIEVLAGSKDRVEVYMDLDMPYPLNRVGLHLRA